MSFQKVEEQQYPVFEFNDKSTETIGYLCEVKGDLGVSKATLYILSKDKDGLEKFGVWGTHVLNKKMHSIKIGELVKIVYLGKVKGKGIQPYHNFEVYLDDGN